MNICESGVHESVLPRNRNCDPLLNNCRKGDWFASNIADCCYTGTFTCNAINDGWWDETVDQAEGDKCQPYACSGQHRFNCGDYGTNSRCVCDDTATYSLEFNKCKCQYWPQPSTQPPPTVPLNTKSTTKTKTKRDQTTEPPPRLSNGITAVIVVASVAVPIIFCVAIICVVLKKCRSQYTTIQ